MGAGLRLLVWFYVVLQSAFLLLRLFGITGWSWWLVSAPSWMPVALAVALACLFGIAVGISVLKNKL